MNVRIVYRTSGSNALKASEQETHATAPIIDFYEYSSLPATKDKLELKSLKQRVVNRIKNDELLQDFWLPERPQTKLGNSNSLVLLATSTLFVPLAIGVMMFF